MLSEYNDVLKCNSVDLHFGNVLVSAIIFIITICRHLTACSMNQSIMCSLKHIKMN